MFIKKYKKKKTVDQTRPDRSRTVWSGPVWCLDWSGLVWKIFRPEFLVWSDFSVKPDQTGPCAALIIITKHLNNDNIIKKIKLIILQNEMGGKKIRIVDIIRGLFNYVLPSLTYISFLLFWFIFSSLSWSNGCSSLTIHYVQLSTIVLLSHWSVSF